MLESRMKPPQGLPDRDTLIAFIRQAGESDKAAIAPALTLESGEREARLIKRLGQSAHRILGVVRKLRREARVEPVDRKSRDSLVLAESEARDLKDGDLVLAQVGGGADRRHGPKRGKVL